MQRLLFVSSRCVRAPTTDMRPLQDLNPVAMKVKLVMHRLQSSKYRYLMWPFPDLVLENRTDGNYSWHFIKTRFLYQLMFPPTRRDILAMYRALLKAATQIQDRVISDAAIAEIRRGFRTARVHRYMSRVIVDYRACKNALTQMRYFSEYIEVNDKGELDNQWFDDPETKEAVYTGGVFFLMACCWVLLIGVAVGSELYDAIALRETGISAEERSMLAAQDNLRMALSYQAALKPEDLQAFRSFNDTASWVRRSLHEMDHDALRLIKLDIARLISEYNETHVAADSPKQLLHAVPSAFSSAEGSVDLTVDPQREVSRWAQVRNLFSRTPDEPSVDTVSAVPTTRDREQAALDGASHLPPKHHFQSPKAPGLSGNVGHIGSSSAADSAVEETLEGHQFGIGVPTAGRLVRDHSPEGDTRGRVATGISRDVEPIARAAFDPWNPPTHTGMPFIFTRSMNAESSRISQPYSSAPEAWRNKFMSDEAIRAELDKRDKEMKRESGAE
eukprot:TRINITY_DN44498_c0_g1_i1.p1 TRINITY_DN44498_c0_g1~~TRINITY_DN44498_c0_g1_i1.p1  ORF type:complete len:502 (-),score=30.03 TRINITY_DN44498_c0_g1_i1:100-1605(-)